MQAWSYAELADAVARIAGGLAARGIGAGDRVLIHCENCPETVLARFACAWLGATALLSNAHLAAPELARIIAALRPRAAITQPSLAERVTQAGGGLEWIAVTETDTADAQRSDRRCAGVIASAGSTASRGRGARRIRPRRR